MFSNRGNVKKQYADETHGIYHTEFYAPNWMPTVMIVSFLFNLLFITWGATSINHQNAVIKEVQDKICLTATPVPLTDYKICR